MKTFLKEAGVTVIAVAVAMQFYVPTRVFGVSMEPNFHQKDYLILSKEAFRDHGPEHGDVVVFQSTLQDKKGNEELLIKRVIGVPGDTVTIEAGRVYLNGVLLREDYIAEGSTQGDMTVTVPEGEYFCMGDNRMRSTDSRSKIVGCVPMDKIKGKVVWRVYPFNKFGRIQSE